MTKPRLEIVVDRDDDTLQRTKLDALDVQVECLRCGYGKDRRNPWVVKMQDCVAEINCPICKTGVM